MTTKNIDTEIDELNSKLKQLEIKLDSLNLQYLQDNNKLQDQILELEKKNRKQAEELESLKQNTVNQEVTTKRGTNSSTNARTRAAFKEGDFVKMINNYKGQYGVIGKVYIVTAAQVHFTNLKGGTSLTRAFRNVQLLHLSEKERRNLLHLPK